MFVSKHSYLPHKISVIVAQVTMGKRHVRSCAITVDKRDTLKIFAFVKQIFPSLTTVCVNWLYSQQAPPIAIVRAYKDRRNFHRQCSQRHSAAIIENTSRDAIRTVPHSSFPLSSREWNMSHTSERR